MSSVVEQYRVSQEPYYRAVADEVALFEAAYSVRMPMMLKGPTGCGKTRVWNTWPGSWASRW